MTSTRMNNEHASQQFIPNEGRVVSIMDTTLRDGEQTSGVSFMPHEKLLIAKALLQDVNVDRIEVASARVSQGELEAVQNICRWASQIGRLHSVEVLGFVDEGKSIDWMEQSGCRVMNLLTKGSLRHCEGQLHKTPQQHLDDIRRHVDMLHAKGMDVNVYLEDWSNGMKSSPNYVFGLMDGLRDVGVKRFMLPDTLGVLNPLLVGTFFGQMVQRYPDCKFDFHAHNDYDLAVGNALAAVLNGASGLHTALNGLGERAGNAPLASVQAVLRDQLNVSTNICEEKLYSASQLVAQYSGIAIPPNKPIVGSSVFTQVAGVHADGDNKNNLYCNELLPERFGRKREYALGKASGKANIRKNLEELGLELSDEAMRKVTQRIIELGDKKELVTQEDLPYIISDVLKHTNIEETVVLRSYMVATAHGLKPSASVKLEVQGEIYEEQATGDGLFDAFVRCLRHIYRDKLGRRFPWLTNYTVSIPPGGRTDALVQTTIEWEFCGKNYRTHALDADQTEAAMKATIKMLNLIEKRYAELNFNES